MFKYSDNLVSDYLWIDYLETGDADCTWILL